MSDLYAEVGVGRPGVAIVAAPPDFEGLGDVVAAAGGRANVVSSWNGFDLSSLNSAELLLVSTSDVTDAVLVDSLPTIAEAASTGGRAVVACLNEAQIDLVASMLFGPQVDLLCEPDPASLAAAVALRLAQCGGPPASTVREREAERLRRLHEEVARIAEVLARLSNTADRRPGIIADRNTEYRGPPPAGTPAVSATDVRRAIRARRLRDQQFPGMLEDPAWDMLLDLYAAELEGAQVSVSSLCIASAVPATTALRWIGRMTDAGLFERQPDPFDRRRAFMALTEEGRERMRRYFALLAQNGLQIA